MRGINLPLKNHQKLLWRGVLKGDPRLAHPTGWSVGMRIPSGSKTDLLQIANDPDSSLFLFTESCWTLGD